MAIKGTMIRALRKVRWVRGANGVPRRACSSCGWAKGLGHDQWCRYVARSWRCLALAVMAATACACNTKKCAEVTYQTLDGTHTSVRRCFVTMGGDLVDVSTQAATGCLAWLADQKRENVVDLKVTEE